MQGKLAILAKRQKNAAWSLRRSWRAAARALARTPPMASFISEEETGDLNLESELTDKMFWNVVGVWVQ